MRSNIRIVSATVHQANKEVEIVFEITENPNRLNEKDTLRSVWINCEEELEKIGAI